MMTPAKLKTSLADMRVVLRADELRGEENAPYRRGGGSRVLRFNLALLDRTMRCMALPPDATDEDLHDLATVAYVALMALAPRNEVEAMTASLTVALYAASAECLRRAMLETHPEAAAKMRRDGANLARTYGDMLGTLDQQRGKGQPSVNVENVTVNAGGQAIVGAVSSTTPHGGGDDSHLAGEAHASRETSKRKPIGRSLDRAALPSENAARPALPTSGDAERALPDARGEVDRAPDGRGNRAHQASAHETRPIQQLSDSAPPPREGALAPRARERRKVLNAARG